MCGLASNKKISIALMMKETKSYSNDVQRDPDPGHSCVFSGDPRYQVTACINILCSIRP